MDAQPKKRFSFYHLLTFGLLFLTWVVFSGQMDAFHLTLGVISCALVTALSADLLFENRSTGIRERLSQGRKMAGYLLWLLYQIVLANFHLLKLVFSKADALQPQIVCYESGLVTDFEKFLLANSITLTPGTITIKIIGDKYYIHAISDVAAAGLDGEMEKRIARIFSNKP